MTDVFVSFTKEDLAIAGRLIAFLRERGWTVGWAPDGSPNHLWDAETRRTFAEARCLIIPWSKAAIQKEWLKTQATKAALRRRLISVLIDDVDPPFVFPLAQPIPLTDAEGRLTHPGLMRLGAILQRIAQSPSPISTEHGDVPIDLGARLDRYDAGWRLRRLLDELGASRSSLSPDDIKSAKVRLTEQMLEDNRSAPEIQRLLTEINNETYRRVLGSACDKMATAGWGDPPVPLTLIVMGSGGRGENYLFSDQDNAFIIGDYPDDAHLRIDAYFRELAERMCGRMDQLGLPYCTGYCMAINPLWRKTLSQWGEQISLWVAKSNFLALRFADIFFDFQPIWGDPEMGGELRRVISKLTRDNPLMLDQMFRQIAVSKVALDFFGNIAAEKGKHLEISKINIKHSGIIPLVETIRVLALREDVAETSTLERIRRLRERGTLSDEEGDDLQGAYHAISDFLVRKEVKAFRAGQNINYDIYPESLIQRDKLLLLGSLRAIRRLRRRLRHKLLQEEL